MKPTQPLFAALLVASVTAHGALYPSGTLNAVIPDANPTGISSTINLSGLLPSTGDVNVMINVSGGFNGDLYVYLSHDGILVPLLNRVGAGPGNPFGYSTAGFNITLDDAAIANGSIHNVLNPVSGQSYQPDSGTSSLANFNTSNPNGNWTIFFSDMASGGGSGPSTLVSWSVDVTPVAEPVNVALGVFAGVFLVVSLARWGWRFRRRIHRYQLYERETPIGPQPGPEPAGAEAHPTDFGPLKWSSQLIAKA